MARWDHLADQMINDRLERADELLDRLGGLNDVEDLIMSGTMEEAGVDVATAQLGRRHAGLLALERMGVSSKWTGLVPGLSALARDDRLIPLVEMSDTDIAFNFHYALSTSHAVVNSVDGTIDPAAPTIRFQGQDIPCSPLASRPTFGNGQHSIFAMPYWKSGTIEFLLKQMPQPQSDEP